MEEDIYKLYTDKGFISKIYEHSYNSTKQQKHAYFLKGQESK